MMNIGLVWHILFYSWAASEIYIAIATRTRRGAGQRLDRGSMTILWITISASITAGEFLANMTSYSMFDRALWLRIAAIALIVIGLAVRWTSIISLGKAFSANVAIRDTQTVYRSGLYSVVRHPSYSGLILIFIAVGLHERNWIAAACVTIPTTAALLYRIHVEEAALSGAFGAEYVDYCKSTKRLVPAIY